MSRKAIATTNLKGRTPKSEFYHTLEYIDKLKMQGYVFDKKVRIDHPNGDIEIDYVLKRYE